MSFQRIFFHNSYDASSRQQLSTLSSDVKVYDVFGADRGNLPSNITLSKLPYLIDKEIVLTTQPPYSVGTIDLKFNCLDYQGNLLVNENNIFHVYVNGDIYNDNAINGVIDLQFTVNQPMNISVNIHMDGYMPFDTVIEVK